MVIENITFDDRTPVGVVKSLLRAMKWHTKIRIFYGDWQSGDDWGEEYDVIGYVGRSSGWMKIPLLLPCRRSTGGGAILDRCVVKIMDVSSKEVLYEHPEFKCKKYEIGPSDLPQYGAAVFVNGEVVARFSTSEKADRWVAFMEGRRMKK